MTMYRQGSKKQAADYQIHSIVCFEKSSASSSASSASSSSGGGDGSTSRGRGTSVCLSSQQPPSTTSIQQRQQQQSEYLQTNKAKTNGLSSASSSSLLLTGHSNYNATTTTTPVETDKTAINFNSNNNNKNDNSNAVHNSDIHAGSTCEDSRSYRSSSSSNSSSFSRSAGGGGGGITTTINNKLNQQQQQPSSSSLFRPTTATTTAKQNRMLTTRRSNGNGSGESTDKYSGAKQQHLLSSAHSSGATESSSCATNSTALVSDVLSLSCGGDGTTTTNNRRRDNNISESKITNRHHNNNNNLDLNSHHPQLNLNPVNNSKSKGKGKSICRQQNKVNNINNNQIEVTESDQQFNFVATAMRVDEEEEGDEFVDNNDPAQTNNVNSSSSYYYNATQPHYRPQTICYVNQEDTTNYQSPRQPISTTAAAAAIQSGQNRGQVQEDDYHLYQVVVPADQLSGEDNMASSMAAAATSPCRSIQRIVHSLFNNNQQQQNHNQTTELSAIIPTIDQNLVSNEPLIRSSSWQNKTLIDLKKHSSTNSAHYAAQNNQNRQLRYTQFAQNQAQAIEQQQQQQQNGEQHLYCGLNTINRSHPHHHHNNYYDGSNYKLNSQSFQTLGADNNKHQQCYLPSSIQMAPDACVGGYPMAGARSAPLFAAAAAGASGSGGGSFSSDSALGFSSSALTSASSKKKAKATKRPRGSGSSARFWLLIMFLFGSLALALLALFSTRPNFPQSSIQRQEGNGIIVNDEGANSKQLLDLYGGSSSSSNSNKMSHLQNELLFKANQNLFQQQQQQQQHQMNHYRVPTALIPLDIGQQPTSNNVAPTGGTVFHYNRPPPPPLTPATYQHQQEQHPSMIDGVEPTSYDKYPSTTMISSITTTTNSDISELEDNHHLMKQTNHWISNGDYLAREWCSLNGNECNLRGHCDRGQCYCLAGYSGPTCAKVNCPNDCSQRGECKLRTDQPLTNLGAFTSGANQQQQQQQQQQDQLIYSQTYLRSLGYETLAIPESRNSICPSKLESEVNQTWAIRQFQEQTITAYDNRLEWQCFCQAGFTGSDCSQLQELRCDDQIDDDQDGLIDCEDDDCCSQPVCSDNLMCFKSPEPTRVLESLSSSTSSSSGTRLLPVLLDNLGDNSFFERMKFLIANESVQSYAQEKAFDKSRVAVIRGKVIKSIDYADSPLSTTNRLSSSKDQDGIVSVRVSVVESAQFGFTLTRSDGYFDMLVNGNEWLTLQFHRNAYAPIKRKIFVPALAITTLDDDIEMALLNNLQQQQQQSSATIQQQRQHRSLVESTTTFDLALKTEIYRLSGLFKRDDERKRNSLFDCLIDNVQQRSSSSPFKILHEPAIVYQQQQQQVGVNSSIPLMRTILPVNQDAFQTQFDLGAGAAAADLPSSTNNQLNKSQQHQLKLVYNSAMFPPSASVVKSVITIKLLDEQSQINQLEAVYLRLDIEGQSSREHLRPVPNLNYQFAWNRRNVYDQKVYGYAELQIRVGYHYKQQQPSVATTTGSSGGGGGSSKQTLMDLWRECSSSVDGEPSFATIDQQLQLVGGGNLDKIKPNVWSNLDLQHKIVWFERKIHLEAHQLNQQADIGKWNLAQSNRLHLERKTIYFGSGWSLPYRLVYPPTLSEPISLSATTSADDHRTQSSYEPDHFNPQRSTGEEVGSGADGGGGATSSGRSLARGPNSSMFVILHNQNRLIQLDESGKKRLIDVPLSIITSKMMMGPSGVELPATNNKPRASSGNLNDFQLIYNNYMSTLYVSSMAAAKIVQVSYSSLLILNKTSSNFQPIAAAADNLSATTTSTMPSGGDGGGSASSSSSAIEEEFDIEPMCGFGRQLLSSNSAHESIRSVRQTRLLGPHSMTLDEEHQVLYFIDGGTNLVALDLHTRHATLLLSPHAGQIRPLDQQQQKQQPTSNWQLSSSSSSGGGGHQPKAAAKSTTNCLMQMRFPLAEFRIHNMHNLVWVKSESSLYFVDQNTVLALRQDYSLEVVAAGPQSPWPASCFASAHELSQQRGDHHQYQYKLGLIKSLVLDDLNGELLLVHRWTSSGSSSSSYSGSSSLPGAAERQQQQQKSIGRLYLAKLKVGIVDNNLSLKQGSSDRRSSSHHVYDLHSVAQTWDPMILALAPPPPQRHRKTAATSTTSNEDPLAINWTAQSQLLDGSKTTTTRSGQSSSTTSQQSSSMPQQQQQQHRPQFLHTIPGGFKSVDSIEINSDGSIFVLDSSVQQIKLIEPFSPFKLLVAQSSSSPRSASASSSSPSNYNEEDLQRSDVNINNRLFGVPAAAAAAASSSSKAQKQTATTTTLSGRQIIGFVNPISGELMEFHANTGIQLSLTTFATAAPSSSSSDTAATGSVSTTTRMDFYYKIFANNKAVDLEEDDKNDLDIQRLVINYMTTAASGGPSSIINSQQQTQSFNQPAERQYVRLDKIVVIQSQLGPIADISSGSGSGSSRIDNSGSRGSEITTTTTTNIELLRSYTGSRFVLQSIISSSPNIGRRTTICEASHDYFGVLISFKLANKDYWTDLIYDGMTYLIRDLVIKKELLPPSNLYQSQRNDFSLLTDQKYPLQQQQQQQQPGSWSQLKRIVYDRVFFHYCNLFVVNA